jgi:hypothetical protein
MPKQVIGRKGRSRQIDDTPAVNVWKTDVVEGKDPDFEYQFFNESQVRDKLHATTVRLTDFETGVVRRSSRRRLGDRSPRHLRRSSWPAGAPTRASPSTTCFATGRWCA